MGTTMDIVGEVATGVSTAEAGIINGIALDADGNPISLALDNVST